MCLRFGATPLPCDSHSKVGISRSVQTGIQPINGLRVKAEGDVSGWYLWGGCEFSEDPEFFVPLHVEHLTAWCPAVVQYLQLPTGWRFLIGPGYEGVWFDPELASREATLGDHSPPKSFSDAES